ncbi:methyltransferase domain-containing protein [Streptomyces oceani]|uniref:Protein-L-isoaspartate O-methyltransferase n=1 Tax=Streptomyces oceani TaxID=1075402 RepID=A0A1E7KFU6_9ACTN|nr:methyltransferase domain-containing protein [Streptomyces oceani]OEV02775.1 methyltransferase [Streptomyces oceani]
MDAPTELAREVVAGGALVDPAWRRAFEEVPRELFVPSYHAVTPDGADQEWRSRDHPDARVRERWWRGLYQDVPLATRMRDGALTSSSSQPSLMARMLEALQVVDGNRVLEVGTGPGWNAALLAHRLGETNVTTVDVDPEITRSAREHLAAAGYHPAVITADGARGCPEHAPYDRLIATCSLPRVPLPWLAQCRTGALILAPFATGLIALRVSDDTHATGRFLATPAYFVPLRGDVPPRASIPVSDTGVPLDARRSDSFQFLLALVGGEIPARWAYEIWRDEGRPARERYGVTVADGEQWVWLDHTDGPHTWLVRSPEDGS